MKRQAWYNWLASMNRPSFGFEYHYETFDEKFGIDPPVKFDPEEIKKACAAHGIKPPMEF